ncbi:sorting nexin-10B isoform X4 [Stegostoma tigrinum]|uniref:sorting nexin-10B isoform X4 n=1 Tax=Stegostoma tigrinum TaxID=3053191 RepID=UPI00202B0039|nr:sorting nexin-10B isoform X4 [Stegostoma tigrinum]
MLPNLSYSCTFPNERPRGERFPTGRMDKTIKDKKKEFISVWVRDPRVKKEDSWHSYVDYEICVHTNSMCFTKKTSCVRRRYREFTWLRQRLQDNAVLIVLQINVLLSDSRLHLFLQTQLNTTEIEACASGQTDYTVDDAVHRHATSNRRFPVEEA